MVDQGFDGLPHTEPIDAYREPLLQAFCFGARKQLDEARIEYSAETPLNQPLSADNPHLTEYIRQNYPAFFDTQLSVFEGVLFSLDDERTFCSNDVLKLFIVTLQRNGSNINYIHERLHAVFSNIFPPEIQKYFGTFLSGERLKTIIKQVVSGETELEDSIIISQLDQAITLSAALSGKLSKNASGSEALFSFMDAGDISEMMKRREYSLEELVAEKSSQFPEPSHNLKYSLQIPTYNEMPESDTEGNQRGNLADYLMSVFVSISKSGIDPSEVEVLCNINNRHDPSRPIFSDDFPYATKGNVHSLQLLTALQVFSQSKLDEDSPERIIDAFEWLPKTQLDKRQESIRSFYVRLFNSARNLYQKGLSVQAVDCTDGSFIAYENKRKSHPVNGQGARRRLLQEIAIRRFGIARKENPMLRADTQWHLANDADAKISPTMFSDIQTITQNTAGSQIIAAPMRMAEDPNSPQKDTNYSHIEISRGAYGLRDLINLVKEFGITNQSERFPKFVPSVTRFAINESAVREGSVLWSIRKDMDEDANFMRKSIANSTFIAAHDPFSTVSDRIRDQSYGGASASVKDITNVFAKKEPQISHALSEAITRTCRSANLNLETPAKPMSVRDFSAFFIKALRSRAFTDQEKALVEEIESIKRDSFPRSIKNYEKTQYTQELWNVWKGIVKIVYLPATDYPNLNKLLTIFSSNIHEVEAQYNSTSLNII